MSFVLELLASALVAAPVVGLVHVLWNWGSAPRKVYYEQCELIKEEQDKSGRAVRDVTELQLKLRLNESKHESLNKLAEYYVSARSIFAKEVIGYVKGSHNEAKPIEIGGGLEEVQSDIARWIADVANELRNISQTEAIMFEAVDHASLTGVTIVATHNALMRLLASKVALLKTIIDQYSPKP